MQRNWFIAAIVIGLVAIVVAAVAMRLSDDGPQTTQEWADEVCTSLSDWRESIASSADVSGEQLTGDLLRDRLADAEDATSDFVADLRELGAPDLESGDGLEAELDEATADLESSFDALRESADSAADANLASEFAALQAAIGQTVTTLQSANVAQESKAELQQAFADAPSCQSLQAAS